MERYFDSEKSGDSSGTTTSFIVEIIEDIIADNSRIRTSALQGAQYYRELMATSSTNRFREITRMDKYCFNLLLDELEQTGKLFSTRLLAGEKLMIFIMTLTGFSNRELQERWQHIGDSISRAIHEVAAAVGGIREKYWSKVDPETVPSAILHNERMYPYFKDCLGALDGTHLPCVPPRDGNPAVFRNRKGNLTTNVLAVVDFDMKFIYCLVGWEGSAHDSAVLRDSLDKGLPLHDGKYYLADAGYSLSKYYHLNQKHAHAVQRCPLSSEGVEKI